MNLFNPSGATGSLDLPHLRRTGSPAAPALRWQASASVAAAVSMLLSGGPARAADDASGGPQSGALVLQEITVTATRREEDINKVPLSITAYTTEQMDDQGIRQMDDL